MIEELISLIEKSNNPLVVCSKAIKVKLLESFSFLVKIKFLTENELVKICYGEYDKDIIYDISKKNNIPFDQAKTISSYFPIIDREVCDNSKLILSIKKKYSPFILKESIKNRDIILVDSSLLLRKLLDNIDVKYIYYSLNSDEFNDKTNNIIFEFESIIDEVEYVAEKIASYIDSGIELNKFKFYFTNSEYFLILKTIFGNYNIPLFKDIPNKLYNYKYARDFLENLDKDLNLYESSLNSFEIIGDNPIKNEIINIVNNTKIEKNYYDYLEYLFKNKVINNIDLTLDSFSDEYLFVLGANEEMIPNVEFDTSFISDDSLMKLGFPTSVDKNEFEKNYVLERVLRTKNLFISYPLKGITSTYNKSSLFSSFITKKIFNIDYIYSKERALLRYSKNLYNNTTEIDNPYQGRLKSTFNSLKKYDNSYKLISNDSLLINKLSLSYSSLQDYFLCPFKFYLSKIVKIKNKDNKKAEIGNLFHFVLMKLYQNNDGLEEIPFYIRKYMEIECITISDLYIKKYTFFLEEIKKEIDIQLENSSFKIESLEEEYKIQLLDEPDVLLIGKIDKVLTFNDYALVVDYKTGSPNLKLDNINYGLDMQLFIYFKLLQKYKFAGAFIQPLIPHTNFSYSKNETYNEQLHDYIKLDGFTNTDDSILNYIDNNISNSSFIKGLSFNKDNEISSKYKKALSHDDSKKVLSKIDEKINEAVNNILGKNFEIKPKIKGTEIDSCKYCDYSHICFKKISDYQVITDSEMDGDEVE